MTPDGVTFLFFLLAGVEDAGMPAAVGTPMAAIAAPLTNFTQQCIADGRLPGCGSHRRWALHNLMEHLPTFSTKPFSSTQAPCLCEGEPSYYMPAHMSLAHASVPTPASQGRDIYADCCSLLVVAFKLFQSLTLKARQAQGSTQGAALQEKKGNGNLHQLAL